MGKYYYQETFHDFQHQPRIIIKVKGQTIFLFLYFALKPSMKSSKEWVKESLWLSKMFFYIVFILVILPFVAVNEP